VHRASGFEIRKSNIGHLQSNMFYIADLKSLIIDLRSLTFGLNSEISPLLNDLETQAEACGYRLFSIRYTQSAIRNAFFRASSIVKCSPVFSPNLMPLTTDL